MNFVFTWENMIRSQFLKTFEGGGGGLGTIFGQV
jgi:hypothetical protein